MLSNELEHCLAEALLQARKTGHGHLTVEHLLLAIRGEGGEHPCDRARPGGGGPRGPRRSPYVARARPQPFVKSNVCVRVL